MCSFRVNVNRKMDFVTTENEKNQIKTEKCDDIVRESDIKFDPIEFAATIKEEPSEIIDCNNVILEDVPWEQSKIKESTVNPVEHTAIEYDENVEIKTEIDIDEPMIVISSTFPVCKLKNKPKSILKSAKKVTPKTSSKSRTLRPQYFNCNYCDKSFRERRSLEWHSRMHPTELRFECEICMQRFATADQMKQHKSNCTVQRFECYLCGYTSLHSHWNRFMDHFRRHTGDTPFKCECCAKGFTSKRMLKFHMKYHPTKMLEKCSFCRRTFASSQEAKQHESQCAIKRQMECYLCKTTFTFKSSLVRHMPQHTGLNHLKCQYCNRTFARKDYLKIHTQSHIQELQFQCKQCQLRFPQKSDLDAHNCTCKIFKCDLCNYTTKSKIYAEDHKQKHIGIDEFKCWHCSEVFLQRSKLVRHVKTHNKKEPFKCQHCQKVYKLWLLLERHQRKCSNAPCSSKSLTT